MKVKFNCKDMDSAGMLHNAFIDALEMPEGYEVDVTIGYGGGAGLNSGYYVSVGEKPVEGMDAIREALHGASLKKKGPPDGEPSSRDD